MIMTFTHGDLCLIHMSSTDPVPKQSKVFPERGEPFLGLP